MAWIWALSSLAAVALAIFYQQRRGGGGILQPQEQGDDPSASSSHPSTQPQHAVYVIGDLHGDAGCAAYWVERTGLIDATTNEWTDPSSSLVFVGDYVDKGIQSKQTVEYVKSLTDLFPERVHALMGNHEIELLRDRTSKVFGGKNGAPAVGYFQLGYSSVHPGEYLNFLTAEDRDDTKDTLAVEALYNASLEAYGEGLYRTTYMIPDEVEGSILTLIPETLRPLVQERLRLYQQRYLDAFRTGTELGTWLEQRPVAAVVGDTLFVHGGVRPEVGSLLRTVDDVQRLNQQLADHAHEEKLQTFLTTTQDGQVVYSLLVYRGNHKEGACAFLPHVLPETVNRLAVGHTPSSSVRLQCDDTFLALDSALSRWFRNSGNEYCLGNAKQISSNGQFQCRQKSEQCEGQIVRIANGQVEVLV